MQANIHSALLNKAASIVKYYFFSLSVHFIFQAYLNMSLDISKLNNVTGLEVIYRQKYDYLFPEILFG